MLIALCALGAAVGIMGNLLLERPEVFIGVVRIASFAGPFLLAVATIIWIGLRHQPKSGLALWGVALLLTPLLAHLALALFFPSGDPLRILSTNRLIVDRLPGQVDQPWVWRELHRRLTSGELTPEEVENAIEELISYMKRVRPTGWNQPLAWQRDFLNSAIGRKQISKDLFIDLCDAFYGPKPQVQPVPAISEGAVEFQVQIVYGNPWSDNSNLGIELLWQVKRLTLDGNQIEPKRIVGVGEHRTVFCNYQLSPGNHLLTIEFVCAYVDANAVMGPNTAELPTSQWPKALRRWTSTVTVPVRIEPAK